MYVFYILYTYIYMCTHYIHTRPYMYTFIYTCVYIHIDMCVYDMCRYIHTHVFIICISEHMCTHYVYTNIRVYISHACIMSIHVPVKTIS